MRLSCAVCGTQWERPANRRGRYPLTCGAADCRRGLRRRQDSGEAEVFSHADSPLRLWGDVARMYRERTGEAIAPARCQALHAGAIRKLRKALAGMTI